MRVDKELMSKGTNVRLCVCACVRVCAVDVCVCVRALSDLQYTSICRCESQVVVSEKFENLAQKMNSTANLHQVLGVDVNDGDDVALDLSRREHDEPKSGTLPC